MEYYIEPAEQTDEVNAQLAAITPSQLNPETLTLIDPASGSGHILVEAYELFKAIYLERGYRQRDVPQLILEKNLFGLDIDERAAQLTGFALMMKGRADDRRLFERGVKLNVMAFVDSTGFDAEGLVKGVELSDYGLKPGDLTELKRLFEHATTFGSLIQVPEGLAEKLPTIKQLSEASSQDLFVSDALKRLGLLVRQAELLAVQYDAVVANPPYLGGKYFPPTLKSYLETNYRTAVADIYPAFVELALRLVNPIGRVSMVTLQNWLFSSGTIDLRSRLITAHTIEHVVQIGFNSFPSMNSKHSMAASFTVRPRMQRGQVTRFANLNDAPESADKEATFIEILAERRLVNVPQDEFISVPERILAFALSSRLRRALADGVKLGDLAPPRRGLATGDNPRFIRAWYEVDVESIGFNMTREEFTRSGRKWVPYNMGGTLRKWYGNNIFVLAWKDDGYEIRNLRADNGRLRSRPQNMDAYFLRSVTWKEIGHEFCGRVGVRGSICDQTSDFLVCDEQRLPSILGYLNSTLASHLLRSLNPTLHFNVGTLKLLPVSSSLEKAGVDDYACRAIDLAREEWDQHEYSWGFSRNAILSANETKAGLLQPTTSAAAAVNGRRIELLRDAERAVNQAVASAYDAEAEVCVEPNEKALGVVAADAPQLIEQLLSFAIGCMMGRYSLDAPGLIYAHSGNDGFDPSRYRTFPADDDGILPLTDTEWFDDDAAHRLIEFISVAWDKTHLEDNLTFLADNLSPKKNESSRDTTRRYLCDKFFKDHLQTYKKRPIYWLFSSGKQKAFQCLVYQHRYYEGTLSRMRSAYVIPLQGKMAARLEKLQGDIQAATSTAQSRRLEKERAKLEKQQGELLAFDEKLRHYADMRIKLDLDDGVKVNYGKFGDLLAEVKAVHGKKAEG